MTGQALQVHARDALTQRLLVAGIIAGPLYIIVGLAQALLREGFDMRRHVISQLSNGQLGWIQIANFLVCGALVIGGAVGVRRALGGETGGRWGPILLGVYGVGMIGGGIFVADPGAGFPPGTPMESSGMSRDGLLHFVSGGIGFYALIAACFVFARRFLKLGQKGRGWYSILSGVAFLVSFAAIASGSASSVTILCFYVAVAWIWIWLTAVLKGVLDAHR